MVWFCGNDSVVLLSSPRSSRTLERKKEGKWMPDVLLDNKHIDFKDST